MSVEDFFRPSKWFVLFCALLVITWGVWQYVAELRLKEESRAAAARLFTWSWPGAAWASKATIIRVSVVHRTDTDATVMVKGCQEVACYPPGARVAQNKISDETTSCRARLTFYRLNNNWKLGKVEFL